MIFAGICAGGQGTRLKSKTNPDTPKQFLLLRGKPVISYSVETFLRLENIEKIFVAAAEENIEYCERLFTNKKVKVIKGGRTRGETVALLAEECERYPGSSPGDILATHDAARPFVTLGAIGRAVEAARAYGVSGTALPAFDTVLRCSEGDVTDAPPRREMFLAQTPQCFKTGLFKEVWDGLSEEERVNATDVCGMFYRAGKRVKIVEGDIECFKITFAEDLDRAENWIRKKEE